MPMLIDGHNLIGRLPQISLEDPDDEEKLVQLLVAYRARTGKRGTGIVVVFDPGAGAALAGRVQRPGVEVVFAPHGSTADAVIAQRVRRSRDRAQWQVVSSDQRLLRTVSELGARVQTAEAFATHLGSAASPLPDWKDTPPSAEEIDAWLDLFSNRAQ
jgi:uncharacterized protein